MLLCQFFYESTLFTHKAKGHRCVFVFYFKNTDIIQKHFDSVVNFGVSRITQSFRQAGFRSKWHSKYLKRLLGYIYGKRPWYIWVTDSDWETEWQRIKIRARARLLELPTQKMFGKVSRVVRKHLPHRRALKCNSLSTRWQHQTDDSSI